MAVFRPWDYQVIFDRETFMALAFIILFGTMAGFSMYLTGVKMIGSVKASLFSCVEPVASMVLTAVWMKVSFTTPDCNCHDHNPGNSYKENNESVRILQRHCILHIMSKNVL